MKLTRRSFAASTVAGLALAGWGRLAMAQGGTPFASEVPGYGPLRPDPAGFFDLPEGFSYRVLSRFGETMADGFQVPDKFDGMGCIALGRGRLALVRNHELGLGAENRGPTGGNPALEARLAALPHFDKGRTGAVLPGGTTTLILDARGQRVISQHLSLIGTAVNCAGGTTPWGSWLSCEESHLDAPNAGKGHGWIFEVPARAPGLVAPVPLKAMGRFRHEAAAVDPATGIVYLTEDQWDGLFYRFIPAVKGQLAKGGRLQALGFADGGADSRNWDRTDWGTAAPRANYAIVLADAHSNQRRRRPSRSRR